MLLLLMNEMKEGKVTTDAFFLITLFNSQDAGTSGYCAEIRGAVYRKLIPSLLRYTQIIGERNDVVIGAKCIW